MYVLAVRPSSWPGYQVPRCPSNSALSPLHQPLVYPTFPPMPRYLSHIQHRTNLAGRRRVGSQLRRLFFVQLPSNRSRRYLFVRSHSSNPGFSSYIISRRYTHIHTYVHPYTTHHGRRPHRLQPLQLHQPCRPRDGRRLRSG